MKELESPYYRSATDEERQLAAELLGMKSVSNDVNKFAKENKISPPGVDFDYFFFNNQEVIRFALMMRVIKQVTNIGWHPFICGAVGTPNEYSGLHEAYLICPAYGSDVVAIYKKVDHDSTIKSGNTINNS